MTDDICLDITDGIAVIRFNRAQALNTFTRGMMDSLGEAYRRCDEDDQVKVVVVTGTGKAFCAGAEISGDGDTFKTQGDMDFSSCPLSFQAWDVRKPVIAALNGHAVGVGLGLALQADMRIFAEQGQYGLLQNRRGVVADFAVEYLLPRMVGMERAFELVVGAVRLSGEQAVEWGLGSRVVPADDVLDTALALARDMADNCSPLVMGLHKKLLWKGLSMPLDEFVALETRMLHHSMGKPDAMEGGMAYFERRQPNWRSSVTGDWPQELN
jgi:enoyl-CoA hydratase/carnithine racemase